MKTNQTRVVKLFENPEIGRASLCVSDFHNSETATRGLLRPTAPDSTLAPLLSVAALTTCILLPLCPGSARAQGGVPIWTNRSFGGHLTLDNSGNLISVGASGLMKYSSDGVPLWANLARASGVIAVDTTGNVFVTSTFEKADGNRDFATVKYSNSGLPLWTNLFDGLGRGSDDPAAIAADVNGNVFVTGASDSGAFNDDFATIKYSNAGVPLWTNYYDGPAGLADLPRALALDSGGNVIVTGLSFTSLSPHDTDYVTIKYSNAGDLLWINYYDGPDDPSGNSADEPWGIAVDSSDNVFVTGISGAANGYLDYATVAYSSAGEPLWTNRYNGPANSEDDAAAVAVDSIGDVFVTGSSYSGSGSDYVTIKYSSAGVPLWTRRYNGPANSNDNARAMALDRAGNVLVTGESYGPNGSAPDYATVAYSNDGTLLWARRYNGPENDVDEATAIAVDLYGNVFVTGVSQNGTNTESVTIKYSSNIALPRLDLQKLNNQLVLSWTNAGFNLQSAPTLTGPFTNIPGATSPYTNSLTCPQQFFRLAQ